MIQNLIFYTLDKAIRSYRRMAQGYIDRAGIDITIDQWLVLRVILENDDLTQNEIAERVFKDQASVARILSLLTQRELLTAVPLPQDGRRNQLRVSEKGQRVIDALLPVVQEYRAKALQGIPEADIRQAQRTLDALILNCTPHAD